MATIYKTRPNCARVKVQVDIAANLPKFLHMVIVDESTREKHTTNVRIQYVHCYSVAKNVSYKVIIRKNEGN